MYDLLYTRKGLPVVIGPELLDVLQDKSCRTFGIKDSGDLKEERSASVLKSALFANDAERLARKTTEQ